MRLFTGIGLPPNVLDRLSTILSELKPLARINWSPIENLHITCRFIGEWPEDRLSALNTTLEGISVSAPVPISVSRFGYFPNPHHPHSLFAGVQAGPALQKLVAAMGPPQKAREYRPHVTLARIKAHADLTALREGIAGMNDFGFGSFDVREFHLYLSQPGPRGSVYTKLATYDLMREKSKIS